MNRTLYTFLFYLALPVILMLLWWRGIKAPAYRKRWRERLGFFTPRHSETEQPLWIHAVSVGETLAIVPLVKLIQARHPDLPIVMTTMTPTGAERVQANFGESVTHYYCPYDVPCALGRFLKKVNPRAAIIVETELWPNLVAACAKRDLPILVANARLSARSAKGYARFGKMAAEMLEQIDLIAVQNSTDGQRFLDLGLPQSAMNVTGSIKFDVKAPEGSERLALALRDMWGKERPVLVGASTHEGEEQVLLTLYKALLDDYPGLLLILVPRHPERFDSVAQLIKSEGLKIARRSHGQQPSSQTQVYLGDTMGELMKLLAAADIAFVGGSLVERGGHNPLEPAVLKKPVLMGPYFFNFQLICDALQEAGGLWVVDDQTMLIEQTKQLLEEPSLQQSVGEKGYAFVKQNQGALERLYTLTVKVCRLPD
ncbi:lipid IV(A) 3-deoxy-D-manno-octulosonic acid transferase [uncultured Neptuniibacter sp.]|uniref:lipid IV(A) 3-deoxy-D-manno-octulosonic acid transferase n=1 Tax=uncultured Neptuniibacter sp. TaxID=502143 RepID=UPI00262E61CD|nr:lipid IV(A) 3-deoxy-D-manno-octulosonic acid transferase [uncultured Neptuniibacter sp.]